VTRLAAIRSRVVQMEQGLLESLRDSNATRANLKRMKEWMKLQQTERTLGELRIRELEGTLGELERRRGTLRERVLVHQRAIRAALIDLERSAREPSRTAKLPERERLEAPRRHVLGRLASRNLVEIEAFRADLADADQLETRIQEERQQLAYLFQDLKERESVMELNRQLQVDLLSRRQADRVAQLENYRKLKSAEGHVERLIRDFNSRLELEREVETERQAAKSMMLGEFARAKGSLRLPVEGRVVGGFGRTLDPRSHLHVFKKGVDIDAGPSRAVVAVAAGKVAFSGELPGYGRVAIVDHGDHFYSLCANLGELARKAGESVKMGDRLGESDTSGAPVYFEIRARNIAVNPLQWMATR
jgi:septal ring factor EnvC (AmiA/AmiB activator)